MRTAVHRLRAAALVAALATAVSGLHAAAAPPLTVSEVLATMRPASGEVPATEALLRARAAFTLIAELKLPEASRAINAALQLDAQNASLHFFNGLVYHLMARQGDVEKTDTAIEGYEQAIRLDPNHWVAHEFLGLAWLEKRQYAKAQAAFAEVLLMRPDDALALVRMTAASYMAGDATTACATADRIDSADGADRMGILRASAMVYASCGEFAKARQRREAWRAAGADDEALRQLDRRIADWQVFHDTRAAAAAAPRRTVQYQPPATGAAAVATASPAPEPAASAADARMVLVDVVMVRTEDSIATAKGINLLSALSLQFGSAGGPAFSRTTNGTLGGTGSTVLTRAITVPALAYTLNIANASSNLNEVLARPTLAAMDGQRSEFFSGTALNAAVVAAGGAGGTGSSVTIERRYGVKLSIQPQIRPDGLIRLTIDASRTFLKPPSSDIGFTYKLEISEILVTANVVMRMGDTLVLGGLSEKETTGSRDGVPGLQDVPLLQYLFARQARTDYQKSVLILITPRPASYTWLSDESRAAAARQPDDAFTPSIDVLRARYSDWFKPYPNLASVFHHLNAADLYREFRTGDVTLQSWDRMDSTRQRLRQALDFLYY
jgi:tetratricopeptide (TPR) repeat protein